MATSYADIAQHAGVSLPTVYSHFPSQHELMDACTCHVATQAPTIPVEAILGAPDLRNATERLVAAADKLNAYFEPWMAWHEGRLVPFLAEFTEGSRKRHVALIIELLSRHLEPGEQRELAAAWESVIHFDLWHRLLREHKLSRAAVRALLVHLLLAVVGPQRANSIHPASAKEVMSMAPTNENRQR